MLQVDFVNWLQDELNRRDWSQADLARKGELTSAQISRIMTRQQKPGKVFCEGIAKAFNMPLESVYRVAGLLKQKPKTDEWVTQTAYKLNQLPPDQRHVVEILINALRETEEKGKSPPK